MIPARAEGILSYQPWIRTMKTRILLSLLAGLVASVAIAQGPMTEHSRHHAAGEGASYMQGMKDHMRAMREAKDPAERKRLMEEHMTSMGGMMPMAPSMAAGGADGHPMMEMCMEMMHEAMNGAGGQAHRHQ
jgi:hypothetical protein